MLNILPVVVVVLLWIKTIEQKKALIPGLEVINLEYILRLKIKRNDWLLSGTQNKKRNDWLPADTCPRDNQTLRFILSLRFELKFYNLEAS